MFRLKKRKVLFNWINVRGAARDFLDLVTGLYSFEAIWSQKKFLKNLESGFFFRPASDCLRFQATPISPRDTKQFSKPATELLRGERFSKNVWKPETVSSSFCFYGGQSPVDSKQTDPVFWLEQSPARHKRLKETCNLKIPLNARTRTRTRARLPPSSLSLSSTHTHYLSLSHLMHYRQTPLSLTHTLFLSFPSTSIHIC